MKSEPVIFHAPFLCLMYDIQQQPLLFPSARTLLFPSIRALLFPSVRALLLPSGWALLFPGSVIDDVFPQ